MQAKKQILEALSRDDLKAIAATYTIDPTDWRSKDALVDALSAARDLPLAEALATLPRAALKAACRSLGLDDSGKVKAEIAERLLSGASASTVTSTAEVHPALAALKRDELIAALDAYALEVEDRRVRDQLVTALAGVDVAELLAPLPRARLKEIARSMGLDDGGKEKAVIIERIVGGQRQRSLFEATTAPTASATNAPERPATKKTAKRGTGMATKAANDTTKDTERTGSLGFESKLWDAADLLRNNMDPAEYKHVVLGLLFLKYIEDAFEERREELRAAVADPDSDYFVEEDERPEELEAVLEDRDEYTAENVFWVPKEARWSHIRAEAKQPSIGKTIDAAMDAIERDNERLNGVLPKVYALPGLDKHNLGLLIDLVSGIGLGTKEHQDKDTLGRVYEYFLSRFASTEGRGGGEFYTPTSVVRLLVEMLEPYKGRVYDPCCGSGGMFVQSLKFIDAHNGKRKDITVYGQESNATTWRMARMNLAIRGIEANLGKQHADSFHRDQHPDLRADFILANPPFNISQWGGERLENDVRWKYGTPPAGNANYAWVQHFIHHLAPTGTAGFVLANGSMSSMQSGEGEIRRKLVEADLVDCIVACPGQLFYATQIPVCLWFLTKTKAGNGHRKRPGETLFIDARKLGQMETRVHRVLDREDIAKVADTYHAWRNKGGAGYEDVAGFCKSASFEEIKAHDFVLTPGRYVGAEEVEQDGEPFEDKMQRLAAELASQMEEGAALDQQIKKTLGRLGYGN